MSEERYGALKFTRPSEESDILRRVRPRYPKISAPETPTPKWGKGKCEAAEDKRRTASPRSAKGRYVMAKFGPPSMGSVAFWIGHPDFPNISGSRPPFPENQRGGGNAKPHRAKNAAGIHGSHRILVGGLVVGWWWWGGDKNYHTFHEVGRTSHDTPGTPNNTASGPSFPPKT